MTRKARSRNSLRRRRGVIQPRQCVLIVCEGEKTEPNYFDSLRRELRVSTVEVEVVGQGAAPITVVDQALRRRTDRQKDVKAGREPVAHDQVWCVFDIEKAGKNPSLPRALDKAKGNGLTLALSNPCFEYWFLLHFVHTGKAFGECRRVLRALRKHLPEYEKGADVFASVYPHTQDAITRARNISKQQWQHEEDPRARDPSTQVHLLVEELRRIATRPYPAP